MEQSNTTEEQSNQPLLESPNSPTWTPMKWVDILLTSTVLSFFVVAGWRGLMGLMNLYPEYFPINETFFLSVFIFVVFAASQSFLNDVLLERPAKSWFMKLVYFLVTKTYIYIFYFNSVMNFNTCEIILGNINQSVQEYGVRLNVWDKGSPVATVLIIFVLNALLIWIRGVKNLLGAPMVLFIDTKEDTFVCDYNFFKMGERTFLYILDCIFSILIVGTLVVFVWRGVWLLVDLFLFPDDNILSSWSSLILGYLIVAIAFLLQPIMRYICERLTGTARLLVADLFILFALIGTVNVWRGIWNLLDIYFLPENLELSCWITHWVSLIILILCKCSNSLLVRGVYIDAEEPAGKCVVFPCYYLRVILRKKKLKKLNLSVFSENDTNKSNNEKTDVSSSNHVVSINTVCDTVEEHNDFK